MTDKKNGREYLGYVLEKLKERITEISLSLVEGQCKRFQIFIFYLYENYVYNTSSAREQSINDK